MFGGRDHSTVINSITKSMNYMQTDPIYRDKVYQVQEIADQIKNKFGGNWNNYYIASMLLHQQNINLIEVSGGWCADLNLLAFLIYWHEKELVKAGALIAAEIDRLQRL